MTKNENGIPRAMAGLVPAIPINWLGVRLNEIAGTPHREHFRAAPGGFDL